jgi:hypothetical protein
MALHRIYFDENEGDALGRYDLGIPGSLRDIPPIAGELKEGMRVLIYMGDDFELEATLEYHAQFARWMARPIDGTLRYLDK